MSEISEEEEIAESLVRESISTARQRLSSEEDIKSSAYYDDGTNLTHEDILEEDEDYQDDFEQEQTNTTSEAFSNDNAFAKTFRPGELRSALNVTFSPGAETSTVKENKTVNHKIDSRMDPSRVKGNDYNKQLMEEWLSNKDKKTKQKMKNELKQQKMKERQKTEEEKEKRALEKKNFAEWERKKKDLLENKIRKSQELRLRKETEKREKEERKAFNQKAFEKWKNKKSILIEEGQKENSRLKKEKKETELQQQNEKKQNQKKAFQRWCERQEELEARKREALRVAREADHELSLILQLRENEAEEEYQQWKRNKDRQIKAARRASHSAAWYPPGVNGNRTDFVITTSTPGAPLSKTLTQVKDAPVYHRKLRTIQACCRPITYWCHCTGSGQDTCRSSPPHTTDLFSSFTNTLRSSSPVNNSLRGSHVYLNGVDDHYSLNRSYDATMGSRSPFNISRHTSPMSTRPHSRASTPG